MVARLTQLISRYVSKALLFVAGLLYANEDQAAELASYGPEVAALVSAILLSVLDLVIHKLKTGGVMVPPGEKKDGGAIGSGGPGVAVLLLMLGLVAVFSPGCVAGPNALKAPSQRKINLYDAFIRESIVSDPTLSEAQKANRLMALDDYQSAVDAAPPAGRWVPVLGVDGVSVGSLAEE